MLNSQNDLSSVKRAICELKPIGKQIPLMLDKEKQKNNRRTVTAFNKKPYMPNNE